MLIFLHLIVFAFAITKLFKSDIELFFKRPSQNSIKEVGNHMMIYLILLWITGIGVIYIDTLFDIEKIMTAQKLLTKLSCVIVLTLNAFVIHMISFKKLANDFLSKTDMYVMSISGAISTSSWIFAGFLGIAKPLVKHLSLENFLSLYGFVVLLATITSIVITPKIISNWKSV